MADTGISLDEVDEADLARRLEDEIRAAARTAFEPDEGLLGCSIIADGDHLEVPVELLGWSERAPVPLPARPGEVRPAVERVLKQIGLRL
jgi:hypothetical protein